MISDFTALCSDLERQELDAPTGVAASNVYSQLLAIYLFQHDLCNAKFLWKRIPPQIKSSNSELSLIWKVGQHMWKKDYPGTYAALKENWSDNVSHIMVALRDEVQKRVTDLVGHAYSFISLSDFAMMAGVNNEDAVRLAADHGWPLDPETQMLKPCKPPPSTNLTTSSEGQLYKLTEFVSFLEN